MNGNSDNGNKDLDLLRKQVLGWTLACAEIIPGLDLGRDLQLSAGPAGLDLARVEGIDALSQTLAIALTTRLGEDVFNTAFGFDGLNALVEETQPVMVRERVRIGVIKVLRKEPRIRRIVDVNLTGDGRLQPPPAGDPRRTLEVRVVFETSSGEQAAVVLGKVTPNG
jgi:phage baseplate assembly protein W